VPPPLITRTLTGHVVWLHPAAVNNPVAPGLPVIKDPIVRGYVTVTLAKPKQLSSLVVHLVAVVDLKLSNGRFAAEMSPRCAQQYH
jgi:hypothetical protein